MSLPRYRSHKIVEGFKIDEIAVLVSGGAVLASVPPEHVVKVDAAYVEKHEPEVGGYYVRYKGGYESWSPADAFEDGYTPVDEIDQLYVVTVGARGADVGEFWKDPTRASGKPLALLDLPTALQHTQRAMEGNGGRAGYAPVLGDLPPHVIQQWDSETKTVWLEALDVI